MDEKNIFVVSIPFFIPWICRESSGKNNSTKEARPNHQENDGPIPKFEDALEPLHIDWEAASEKLSINCAIEINPTDPDTLRSSRWINTPVYDNDNDNIEPIVNWIP